MKTRNQFLKVLRGLALLFAVSLVSCKNIVNEAETIYIDPATATEKTNWKEVLDTTYLKMVVLETSEEYLIGEIHKIIYEDDMLIIADIMSASVLFFNTDGKFLHKICKIGRGPGEYTELTDICVKDGKVWLLDNISCQVICYDYTGKMLHKFDTQGGITIQALDNSVLIGDVWGGVAAGGPYLLSEYDFDGNQLGRYLEYSELDEYRDNGEWRQFSGADNKSTNFLLTSKDEVWHYRKGEVYLKYRFDLGKYTMPEKYKLEGTEYIVRNRLQNEYGFGVISIWESSLYQFARIHIQGDKYLCILNKDDNSIISLSKSMSIDVFNLSGGTLNKTDGDYLLSYHSGITLYQLYEYIWKPNPETVKGENIDLYEISKTMSADDNGVVVMMKLKNK